MELSSKGTRNFARDTFGAHESGVLSDGRVSLPRVRLDEQLTAVDAFLVDRGLSWEEPVALECPDTVAGAVVLLALLARGQTVVLLPAARAAVPRFVRWRLVLAAADGPAEFVDPARCVGCEAVDDARPLPEDATLRRGRVLLRTSGSLGAPKLVVHTHTGLLANAAGAVERLALTADDRVLIPVPLAHMYGLGAGLLPALFAGAAIDLLAGANILRYFERERGFGPTVAFLTPNLCATLLRPRGSTGTYRHVVVAGDRLGPAAFAAAESLYRRVVALYGSTEMGVIAAADARAEVRRATTAGRPLPGVALRLRAWPDDDAGAGELQCAHPHGFAGYVDDDGVALPVEARDEDGWYATRDMARLHPDGEVELLGRCDHAVKRDGRLVMLAEVERALERLSAVERAAAVVAGDTPRGRRIVAFCAPRGGAEPDPAVLRRDCQAVLPAWAVPDELRVLPTLPLLPGGKLDRTKLQNEALSP